MNGSLELIRNLELLLSVTAFLVLCSLVVFPLALFPPSECSRHLGEMRNTMTLRQNVAAFILQIMYVTGIVTIMVWWLLRHEPWLQISFPTF